MKTVKKKRTRASLLAPALLFLLLSTGCSASKENSGSGEENVDNGMNKTASDENETTDPEGVSEAESADASAGNDGQKPDAETDDDTEPIPSTVTILGTEYDRDIAELDISKCAPEDVSEIAGIICDMPELEAINLMDENDTSLLAPADVKLLMDAAPEAEFTYSFDLYGQRLSLSCNAVRYVNADIGNDGEEEIRDALSVLKECSYFVLDDCGIDDEIMAGIRDDFPDTKVVWRVHVGNKSALTDDTVIRMTHGIDDTMTGPLQYCTDVVYMDLGHDSGISDISFVSNMHDLECLILSSARVSDLSPLKNCQKLTWLELVYCGLVTDASDLTEIGSLKYLNISYTKIHDLEAVSKLDLERLCCIGNGITQEMIDEYTETHPDCMTSFKGTPWGYAWRYDDYGYHFFSYYARMREVFRYEERSPGGFKFPEYEEPVFDTEVSNAEVSGVGEKQDIESGEQNGKADETDDALQDGTEITDGTETESDTGINENSGNGTDAGINGNDTTQNTTDVNVTDNAENIVNVK